MRILVDFINGNDYWQSKVLASAKQGGLVLSDPALLNRVEDFVKLDFRGKPILDPITNLPIKMFDFCDKTPAQVADLIRNAGDVMIKVAFFRGWPWSKVLASEGDGQVSFNTRKDAYGAGGVGNVVHETLHALGFMHNGNASAGNENSAPYWIGNLAETWVIKPATTAPKVEVESVT